MAGGGAGGDVAASVAFLQRRSQAPWAGEGLGLGFGDDGERAREIQLTRRGAATPPFSPPFSPPASPTPRRVVPSADASSRASFHAIDDADESPRALTLDAMRRALDRGGDNLGTLRSVFAAVCGSYVEARSRGAAAAAGARFRASFRARGGVVGGEDDPSSPEPRRATPSSPRRRDIPPSSPAVSPSDAYALVFRPHVHALLVPGVVTGGRRVRRRALRAARAAVVEYLLAAEQSGASREFGAGRHLSSSGSSLGSSLGSSRGVAMCARLCVAASVALGEARRTSAWKTLLVDAGYDDEEEEAADFLRRETSSVSIRGRSRGDDDADDCDADACDAVDMERQAGRGTAATVRIPARDGQSPVASNPAEAFASLAGRPVRLAAAHRWYEETSPGSLRGTPLGAKYRRAFDPDAGGSDGAGTDEEERGEVHPGDTDTTPRG